ncbi:MAG TPA: serine hydrolase [Xanthobacteraceae bacterium]|nr:serine hydrolase [Xanthobacteraceae bacterium]
MAWLDVGARHGLRCCLLSLAAIAAALTISSDAADARRHHRLHVHHVHAGRGHRHARAENYDPPFSSIVVDGNSGAVLQASNPDALRHPASLTKVMTLYLLFERLDAGAIKLDTPLRVSERAAEQAPTKLELKSGRAITVEDAIKGVVTKSANDAAVAVAENLGGSEDAFARLMTQKAHALGMSRTTYVNASGLPDDDQITTARDQALLGRAIQDRFPRYYKYFSIASFVYHGEAIRNHDRLLRSVEGVDGIKTGFTRASGFNLLTSVHRDGRYLVAVVMGGPTAAERDERMRELIGAHLKEAALHRTAPLIADAAESRERPQPVAFAKAPAAAHTDAAPTPMIVAHTAAAASDPIKPVVVRTISYRTVPVQTAALAPMPMLMPVGAPAAQTAPALPSGRPQSAAVDPPQTVVAPALPVEDAKAAKPEPADTGAVTARAAAAADEEPSERQQPDVAEAQSARLDAIPSAPVHAHGGWLIQIGAFDDENDAKQHLSAAQLKVRAALAAKDPFTERIQKGDKALYRARFAGFDRVTAEAACRQLKRSDFECMALKD